ncbi:hypothetical protein [Vagococcus xieshaowenii]|uniref:Uncharacterized protein n=1 Tax=Vagococcus xieshaowenii TaxID=2562451 RepID=A0AAJ5EGW6_9ENTE|nr:hypothetical protein [Vagococcus xieshaowenii]QCA28380.1 hypothetical protein E4Z98_03285 [Vagococcus xieshaowenii]TFZ42863.1 hypothetical protein E4031_02455 [Vagococcus xieshaowenii]
MKESIDRKFFRFPAFSDKEGVKLATQPKREIFEKHEPVIITKYQQVVSNKIEELRHLDEIEELNEMNQVDEQQLEPTKEKNWQPKTAKKEKSSKGLAIKPNVANDQQDKKSKSQFASTYEPPISKRITQEPKSWLPEDVEERIDKHAALEEKLANTRFAEDKEKFVPKAIPQQMHGQDPTIEVEQKVALAKQLSKDKQSYLVLASDEDDALPELKNEELVDEQISPEMEDMALEVSYTEVEPIQRNKRTIPQLPKKDIIPEPKISAFSKKEDLETPVFKKKNGTEEVNRTRLDKSLSGIMSDEGKLTNSIYFDSDN